MGFNAKTTKVGRWAHNCSTGTYIKFDPPSASALERRGRGVEVLAPEREELLDAQRPRRVVADVRDAVLLTNRHQAGVHVQGELHTNGALLSTLTYLF